jgi:3-dehydroquinate dehydratase-2
LQKYIRECADALSLKVTLFQSNHEGEIVDVIQAAYGVYDGIVINPAAYTHTSVAILDALKAVGIPTVEVHLSDVNSREEFRRHSFVSLVAKKTIAGLGFEGYKQALEYFA